MWLYLANELWADIEQSGAWKVPVPLNFGTPDFCYCYEKSFPRLFCPFSLKKHTRTGAISWAQERWASPAAPRDPWWCVMGILSDGAFRWIFKHQCWNTCVMTYIELVTFMNLYKMVLYVYHKASKWASYCNLLIFLWYMWEVMALIDFIDEETESLGWDLAETLSQDTWLRPQLLCDGARISKPSCLTLSLSKFPISLYCFFRKMKEQEE